MLFPFQIPGVEGKAGMASIQTSSSSSSLDLSELSSILSSRLPPYAQPLFLRLVTQIDLTGTFKLKKFRLQKQGYNPKEVDGERLYFLHPKTGRYEELDEGLYADIVHGNIRL